MKKLLAFIVLLCAGTAAAAATVDDVKVPETATVAGKTLQLNGAGLRTKFFVHVYVGALYLPQKTQSADAAIGMDGPDRVLMHMLYAASRSQMTDAFNDDFHDNLSRDGYAALKDRINTFLDYFGDTHHGEEITIDYAPGTGTQVTIDGQVKGTIPGEDFHRAVMLVWLGRDPADGGLKRAMLGQ